MQRILLMEDDAALGQGICLALKDSSVQIRLCQTLAQGRRALENGSFALLILDVNLPDGSGLDLLREVRRTSAVPIILLTANDLETDIVLGLESGADDYITKPFSLAVLRARVNAQLRRSAPAQGAAVELDGFSFDFEWMEFRKNGQLIRTEQNGTAAATGPDGKPWPRPVPRDAAGAGVAGRRGVCGGKRPVGHRQAPAGQAGGHALQAPLSENGLWHRLHLGGELT